VLHCTICHHCALGICTLGTFIIHVKIAELNFSFIDTSAPEKCG